MIAAVLLRIVFAGAGFHNMKGFFKNLNQRIFFMHQLLQISRAAGNRIVDHEILFAIVGIRDGYFADSSPEVIDIAKIFFHTKHEGRNKGFHPDGRRVHRRSGNQKSENLCAEFTIQKQTFFIGIGL